MALNVNLGCGRSPTEGWHNYDSSPSLKLAKNPMLAKLVACVWKFDSNQKAFIEFAKKSNIKWANVTVRIPETDSSVDTIYSCHMLEHLDDNGIGAFLQEAKRVLKSGGMIRLAVPDVRWHVENYLVDGDADRFIRKLKLTRNRPTSLLGVIKNWLVTDRGHKWMYDGQSLCKLLEEHGFVRAQVMEPGKTLIPSPGALNLSERSPESVFVEAFRP